MMAAFEVGKTYRTTNARNMAEQNLKVVKADSQKALTLPRRVWFKLSPGDYVLELHACMVYTDTGEQVERCFYCHEVEVRDAGTYTEGFMVTAEDVVDDD